MVKTLDEICAYKGGECCNMLDQRDRSRLIDFIPVERWGEHGFGLKEGAGPPEPEELTRENVLRRLRSDLDFAIEKAEDERGISSNLMHEVVRMWLWVLDDEMAEEVDYDNYGLPFYRAVESKYREELVAAERGLS